MPRLLLIDPDPKESARYVEMLNVPGYEVEHVLTLDDGIAQASTTDFDAVLLNVTLSESDGLASFLVAREQLSRLPFVILTPAVDDSCIALAYRRGAQDVLFKSKVCPEWLSHSVKHAIFRFQAAKLEAKTESEPTAKSGSLWSQERIDDVIVLRLIPKRLLDSNAILAIEERLGSLVNAGNHQLVVNMENVEYVSNAALGVFIGVQKKIRGQNGQLHLANLRKNVRNQLGSRQFHRLFQIYNDVPSAIASIATSP